MNTFVSATVSCSFSILPPQARRATPTRLANQVASAAEDYSFGHAVDARCRGDVHGVPAPSPKKNYEKIFLLEGGIEKCLSEALSKSAVVATKS